MYAEHKNLIFNVSDRMSAFCDFYKWYLGTFKKTRLRQVNRIVQERRKWSVSGLLTWVSLLLNYILLIQDGIALLL